MEVLSKKEKLEVFGGNKVKFTVIRGKTKRVFEINNEGPSGYTMKDLTEKKPFGDRKEKLSNLLTSYMSTEDENDMNVGNKRKRIFSSEIIKKKRRKLNSKKFDVEITDGQNSFLFEGVQGLKWNNAHKMLLESSFQITSQNLDSITLRMRTVMIDPRL